MSLTRNHRKMSTENPSDKVASAGPWFARQNLVGEWQVNFEDKDFAPSICYVTPCIYHPGDRGMNARLLAAAPSLRGALARLLAATPTNPASADQLAARKMAMDALDLADGRTGA